MSAAFSGKPGCLKLLINAGADLTLKDKNGRTALDWAKQQKEAACVALLEAAGAPVAWSLTAPGLAVLGDLAGLKTLLADDPSKANVPDVSSAPARPAARPLDPRSRARATPLLPRRPPAALRRGTE